jgi:hypothetical protein
VIFHSCSSLDEVSDFLQIHVSFFPLHCQVDYFTPFGKQIDVIYLDMSKAFDKVSHVRLLHRLR